MQWHIIWSSIDFIKSLYMGKVTKSKLTCNSKLLGKLFFFIKHKLTNANRMSKYVVYNELLFSACLVVKESLFETSIFSFDKVTIKCWKFQPKILKIFHKLFSIQLWHLFPETVIKVTTCCSCARKACFPSSCTDEFFIGLISSNSLLWRCIFFYRNVIMSSLIILFSITLPLHSSSFSSPQIIIA